MALKSIKLLFAFYEHARVIYGLNTLRNFQKQNKYLEVYQLAAPSMITTSCCYICITTFRVLAQVTT